MTALSRHTHSTMHFPTTEIDKDHMGQLMSKHIHVEQALTESPKQQWQDTHPNAKEIDGRGRPKAGAANGRDAFEKGHGSDRRQAG